MSKKALRNIKEYNFRNYVLEGISMVYPVTQKRGFYLIKTSKYGNLDMYPKADKIMFHRSGKWISGGAEWLCNNL